MNDSIKLRKPKKPDFQVDGVDYYISEINALFMWIGEYEVSKFPTATRWDKRRKFTIPEDKLEQQNYRVWVDHEYQAITHLERL